MARSMVSEIGIGKGRFRKAFLSCLQMRHSQPDASERATEELGDECVYCGISGTEERLQFDHLWPQASGGLTIIGNIVPCCPTCNSDRRDIPWEDYLRESPRVRARRSPPEVGGQIRKISIYMERHGQANKPTIESVLTRDELRLREDFNLMFHKLCSRMKRIGQRTVSGDPLLPLTKRGLPRPGAVHVLSRTLTGQRTTRRPPVESDCRPPSSGRTCRTSRAART